MAERLTLTVQRSTLQLRVGTVPAVAGGGDVASVFGRTGAVVASSGDYTAAQVGADATGTAAAAVAAHVAAGDPHTQYAREGAGWSGPAFAYIGATDLLEVATPGAAPSVLAVASDGTVETYEVGALGAALLDDASAAAGRTTLGLVIGTDVAAHDAGLASLAGVDTAADRLPYTSGVAAWTWTALTAAGRALLDDADAEAQRATLGLGTAATLNTGDVVRAGDVVGGVQLASSTAAITDNAASWTTVTGLSFTPTASAKYLIEMFAVAQSAGLTQGIGLKFVDSSSATWSAGLLQGSAAAAPAAPYASGGPAGDEFVTLNPPAGTTERAIFLGTLIMQAAASPTGALTVQARAEIAAGGIVTIHEVHLRITRLA